MKITVSYINSLYDSKKTVDLINETSADAIHVDLIDGIYAGTKNFDIYQKFLKIIENQLIFI